MRLDGNWGDHLTLQAASNVYGLEIRVYTSYDGNWERVIRPTDDGNIRRAIQLSFYAELHYNSVYPNTEFDSDDYEQINENLLNERTKLRHRAKFNRVPSIYSRYNGDEWVNRRLRQIDSELDTNHAQMQKKRMQKKRRSYEQSLKDTKEELELLKHKAEVDKLKEEDIEKEFDLPSSERKGRRGGVEIYRRRRGDC